jgi:hypothetical protein
MILKQGANYNRLFLMVQTADHISGITGASPVVKLSKAGATGVTAINSPATQVDATNLPGVYQILISGGDANVLGDLAYNITATGADPTTFIDQVQAQVFTDLSMNASGQVLVASNLKQNTAFTALFFMTQLGANNPAPNLTVSGQRTFGIAGFSPVTGTIAEVGGAGAGAGWYVLNGAPTDSNSACVGFKMTAPGANDTDFTIWTQP